MSHTFETRHLTHAAMLKMLGVIRMNGAKFLSRKSALTKARTAASIRGPSNSIPEDFRPHISAAMQNTITGIGGGLPIVIDGFFLGGIGVGSGTADQDIEVGPAALAEIGANIPA